MVLSTQNTNIPLNCSVQYFFVYWLKACLMAYFGMAEASFADFHGWQQQQELCNSIHYAMSPRTKAPL